MKLINTTDFPDAFLRRMISWVCKELEHPVRKINQAKYRNRWGDWRTSGHAWWGRRWGNPRYCVSIGRPMLSATGVESWMMPMAKTDLASDPTWKARKITRLGWKAEGYYQIFPYCTTSILSAVSVTAHEIFHLYAAANGINSRRFGRGRGSSEAQTNRHEEMVKNAFLLQQDELMEEWRRPRKKRKTATV